MIEVQIIITNKFGEFKGKSVRMEEEDVKKLLVMSKNFYSTGGFELTCEDGSFVVFPPDVVKDSMLRVIIKND
jgi:ribosomal protein S4E